MMSSPNRFRRIFWIVAGLHGGLILVLVFYSVIQRWLIRKPPREVVTFVSLHSPAPPAAIEAAPTPAPAPPPPPPPAPRPKIERSQERVRRDVPPPTPPAARQLTPEQLEQIQQRLEQAVSTTTAPASGSSDEYSRYLALIHETLYRAWEQPASVLPGTTASARIRVQRDGSISRREIIKTSGNTTMDASILRALQSVSRLSPLPQQISGTHHEFTIEFELTGARL